MEKRFRFLVTASAVLLVLVWLAPFFQHHWMSEDQLFVAEDDGLGAVVEMSYAMYWVILVVWLWLTFGVAMYHRTARTLYVGFTALVTASSLLMGLRTATGVDGVLDGLLYLSIGAILAMAYWSPLSARFEADRSPNNGRSADA